jgi:glycyl-tRNA synthetase beta chain
MNAPLLIELLTEELPPKALARLGESFAATLTDGLRQQGLAPAAGTVDVFATPRRLAVRVHEVRERADDRAIEIKGPSVAVGLDAQGEPTLALRKWAEKQGATVSSLVRASDGKQECFYFRSTAAGATLDQAVGALVNQAISKLPIPKLMQYQLADGITDVSFVRPAHGLSHYTVNACSPPRRWACSRVAPRRVTGFRAKPTSTSRTQHTTSHCLLNAVGCRPH